MVEDYDAGVRHKAGGGRWWYPAVRLSQVAAPARLAARLIMLNEGDRASALARGWKREPCVDLVPHGVSGRFLSDVPPADHPRGRGILFCGTWDAMKGVHYLAAAFSQLVA